MRNSTADKANYDYGNPTFVPSNSKIVQFFKLLQSKGLGYTFKKMLCLSTCRIWRLSNASFPFNEKQLTYCVSKYNSTFANERTLEIPIGRYFLYQSECENILEIGNVLSHYMPKITWTIVDKYEQDSHALNIDIIDFEQDKRFDLIISISTLEHIGFNESPKDPSKLIRVINHIKTNLLDDNGIFIATFPLGWNPKLDKMVYHEGLGFDELICYKRCGFTNRWKITAVPELDEMSYGTYNGADYLIVATYFHSRKE